MLLDIYRQCVFNRLFEHRVADDMKAGKITCPTYLSVGSEHIPILLKTALQELNITKCNFFCQHRCHSYYLTFIEEPLKLLLELYGSPKGCNGGYGGSASISGQKDEFKMWGHDGLLGSNAPIAVGYADATKELTICVLGDGAVEEDYILGAIGYAVTKHCPILFLIEDNNLSILTPTNERRNWDIFYVADGFKNNMGDSTKLNDSIYILKDIIKSKIYNIVNAFPPYLLNIQVCRHYWHVGAGTDGAPKYDYLDDLEKTIKASKEYKQGDLVQINKETQNKIDNIWKQLETQLKD